MDQNPDEAWFETWFDTPLYEQLYANRDMAEAKKLARLIASHAPASRFSPVLDAGCGRGRHSINLARMGYEVTGVDLSEKSIEKAESIRKTLSFSSRLRFRVHDLRTPLTYTYPLVVNLFTSFGYLNTDEENTGILSNMCRSVQPGGLLIIDYLNAGLVAENLVAEEKKSVNGFKVEIKRHIENNTVIKRMTFHKDNARPQTFTEQVKLYDRPWFESELKSRGLLCESFFGDYDGRTHHPETSPRLIILARRK